MREKLIELLDKAKNEFWCSRERCNGTEFIADYLVANGVTVQQWIPVSERLPEWGTKVLIYTTFKDVLVSQWDGKNRIWVGDFCFYAERVVTHWMPMLEPPKED